MTNLHGFRRRRLSRRLATLSVLGLVLSCSAQGSSGSLGVCDVSTFDDSWARGLTQGENPAYISRVVPTWLRDSADTVFYAETPDLDCDGTKDLVVHFAEHADRTALRLSVFLSSGDSLVEALTAQSKVRGREVLVSSGELRGQTRRDFVTLGSDEGGLSPRVFVWTGMRVTEIPVPRDYLLRMEAEWSADCRARQSPRIISGRRLVLSRETISRTELRGHGTECELPRDTLFVVNDSLALRSPG